MTKITVLVVDDDPTTLTATSSILKDQYHVRIANSGERAIQVAQTAPFPELILLDISMPGMDGFEVIRELKNNDKTQNIPVIFVTAMESEGDEETGLSLGAVDYITKPIKPAILLARTMTHVTLKQAQDFLVDQNEFLEAEISRRLKENITVQNVSIRALAHLAETRDPETGDHILRTQSYVNELAKLLQSHSRFKSLISKHFVDLLTKSAPLHDIGKVGIPDHVLLKPGKFNRDEWLIMQTHAEIGARAIEYAEKDVKQPVEFLSLAKEIAHWHHERWDGSGYPDKLKGDDIPLSARIMALADVFDALISSRIYKEPMSFADTWDVIEAEQGHQFDPDIAKVFLDNFDVFVEIAYKYQNMP